MEIIQGDRLLLNLGKPERVLEAIKTSKVVGKDGDSTQVVVPWRLPESQALKALRIKNVPSPIHRDYKWTGIHKPFAHQKETSGFLTLHRRAFCFNEQGTGKTASVIWAADYLMALGFIRRVLVICPLSIMQSAWQADLFKFAMHRTVDVAYGSAEKRKKITAGDAEFVIINYDGVEIVEKEISENAFDLIVVDEASAYKTATTRRWKILNRLVTSDKWLWMLTGTPAAQSPVDAFGIAKLVNPLGVPKHFGNFRDMVMYRLTQYRWVPKDNAKEIVHRALQPAIRFAKADCLDLPEMTYVDRDVPMTKTQQAYYKRMMIDQLITAEDEEISAVNAAVLMNKLLQMSCGVVYSDTKEVISFDASSRLNVLTEIISETSNKVLVFVPFRHAITMVREHLTKEGFTTDVISGDVAAGKRTDIFKSFQTTPDPRVLVIQPQAAAHGVTLTAADTVVWYGPTTSLETYLQANARVHRAGQKNAVTVIHIVGSSVERKIYRLLREREDVHAKIIDLYREEVLDTAK
jgi:SNF2 family DNA or RNA helicase